MTKEGLEAKAIPVPRNISSDCGIALKVRRADVVIIESFFEDGRLTRQGLYEVPE